MQLSIKSILIILLTISLSIEMGFSQKKSKKKFRKELKKTDSQKESKYFSSLDYRKERDAKESFMKGIKCYAKGDHNEAIKHLFFAEKINPSESAIKYFISKSYFQLKNLSQAILYGKRAFHLERSNLHYAQSLAYLYRINNKLENSVHIYEEIIKQDQAPERVFLDLIDLYLLTKKYRSSLEILNLGEEKFGRNPMFSLRKQRIYLELKQYDQAIEEWKKYIRNFLPDIENSLSLIKNLLTRNQFKFLPAMLSELKRNYTDSNPEILLLEMRIMKKKGEKALYSEKIHQILMNPQISFKEKKNIFYEFSSSSFIDETALINMIQKMMNMHPGTIELYLSYAHLLMGKMQYKAARTYYLKALDVEKNNFSFWRQIIYIDREINDLSSVITHSELAIERFPYKWELYLYAGEAHSIKKNYQKAKTLLEQGKSFCKDSFLLADFNSQLGNIYHYLKEYRKSNEAFDAALAFDPDNIQILNNYSYFLSLRRENLQRAKQMAKKMISLAPENATYLDTYGWTLYVNGEFDTAKEILEKAVKNSSNPTIIEHYADVLFKVGQKEKALIFWKKALQKSGNDNVEILRKKINIQSLIE